MQMNIGVSYTLLLTLLVSLPTTFVHASAPAAASASASAEEKEFTFERETTLLSPTCINSVVRLRNNRTQSILWIDRQYLIHESDQEISIEPILGQGQSSAMKRDESSSTIRELFSRVAMHHLAENRKPNFKVTFDTDEAPPGASSRHGIGYEVEEMGHDHAVEFVRQHRASDRTPVHRPSKCKDLMQKALAWFTR